MGKRRSLLLNDRTGFGNAVFANIVCGVMEYWSAGVLDKRILTEFL
jgi:hypothetical protein